MAKKGKKGNKGCGCLVAFVVVFFGLPGAFSGVMAAIDYLAEAEERAFKEQWPAFFDPFDRAAAHLDTGDYLDALSAAEEALAAALATPELHADYLARAYARKAEAHIGLWHYIDAEATLLDRSVSWNVYWALVSRATSPKRPGRPRAPTVSQTPR